jgi:hypothetical protein
MLWGVLCLNVSAGIGILYVASPLLQEVFGGKLIGLNIAFSALNNDQKTAVAMVGASFTGLLSLFNIGGRFFWASLSDHLGRKWTYHLFFAVGFILYVLTAHAAASKNITLFVGMCCVIVSMYGGGFATIPAYLADLFGTQFVGAIHGRLLTAWSTAAVIGYSVMAYIGQKQGPKDVAYTNALYVLAGMLFIGFICNLLVRPIEEHHFMSDEELKEVRKDVHDQKSIPAENATEVKYTKPSAASWIKVAVAWTFVGVPLTWGIYTTVINAMAFFK